MCEPEPCVMKIGCGWTRPRSFEPTPPATTSRAAAYRLTDAPSAYVRSVSTDGPAGDLNLVERTMENSWRSSGHQPATIDVKNLPGDVAGAVRGEEQRCFGDLLAQPHSFERSHFDCLLDLRSGDVPVRLPIRLNRARADRGDADYPN